MYGRSYYEHTDPRQETALGWYPLIVVVLALLAYLANRSAGTESHAATCDRNDSGSRAHSATASNVTGRGAYSDDSATIVAPRMEITKPADDEEASETGARAAEVTVNALTTKTIDFATTSNNGAPFEPPRTEHAEANVKEEQAGDRANVEVSNGATLSDYVCRYAYERTEETKARLAERAARDRAWLERLKEKVAEEKREKLAAAERERQRVEEVERREREEKQWRREVAWLERRARAELVLQQWEKDKAAAEERQRRSAEEWERRRVWREEWERKDRELAEREREERELAKVLWEDELHLQAFLRSRAQAQCAPTHQPDTASTVPSTQGFTAPKPLATSRPATVYTPTQSVDDDEQG